MRRQQDPLRAIILVLSSMAIAPLVDVMAKYLGQQGIPVSELVWGRLFFGAAFTLPLALSAVGKATLRPANLLVNLLRTCCLLVGTGFFFLALKYLPVADTLAIYFVQPLFITALSPLVLREYVSPRRWTMVFLGFIGVLIIIRPGFQNVNLGQIFAFCAGLSSAFYFLMTHFLNGKAAPIVTTFQTSAIGAVALSAASPIYWLQPSSSQWLMMVGLGGVAILAHYLIAKAYSYADASLLSPLNYSEMVTSVALGWIVFHDFPDRFTFLGASILIGCAIYISRHERQKARSEPTGVVD